jgi:WD40 repeat protein
LRSFSLARRRFQGHEESVSSVAVLADGRRALSGSWDKTLRLWDLESGAELRASKATRHRSARWRCWRTAAARSPALMTGRCGCGLWDLETGAELAVFTGDAAITAVAVAHNDLFVAGSANGAIHILRADRTETGLRYLRADTGASIASHLRVDVEQVRFRPTMRPLSSLGNCR